MLYCGMFSQGLKVKRNLNPSDDLSYFNAILCITTRLLVTIDQMLNNDDLL